jgi:hypothetical protein
MSVKIEITKYKFIKYEGVRVSGVTNMFDVTTVSKVSGLTKEECLEIMFNYTYFKEEFIKGN